MEQKKFLTLLPIMFLAIISIFLLASRGASDRSNVLGECVQNFIDEGLDLKIPYPCDWNISLITDVLPDFVANDDGTFGHPVQTYNVNMYDDDNSLKVKISVLFADTQGKVINLDENYEVIEIEDDNKIVRFLSEDGESYRYTEYIECDGNDCARTILRGVTSNFPSVIEVYDLNNPSEYDAMIEGILSR